MRALRLVAALLVVYGVHLVATRVYPEFPLFVDLFVVVIAYQAFDGNTVAALATGCLVGLVQDSLSGGPYGLHGFAGTLVGYVAAVAAQHLVLQRGVVVVLFFALAAALKQALVMGLLLLLASHPDVPSIGSLAVMAVVGGALGQLTIWTREELLRRHGAWKDRRTTKLRLG
jgi:rod shape-determining protein MreD